MVAGHYQPLADDGATIAIPCTVRPNLSSAVGSEDKDKQADMGPSITFSTAPPGLACLRPLKRLKERALTEAGRQALSACLPYYHCHLLHFDLRTGVFQLLLRCFGVGLADAFLDRLGRAIDQVLGFLETEARELAHRLDDVHLVVTERGEHDGELGLFFRGRRGGGAGGRRTRDGNRSGGRNAELLFHRLDELGELEDRHRRDLVEDFSFCTSHYVLLNRKG